MQKLHLKIKEITRRNTGDIIVKSSNLKPLKVNKNFYVSATDEYPIMFVMPALTKDGYLVLKELKVLKNKESDRVKEMQKILGAIGVNNL